MKFNIHAGHNKKGKVGCGAIGFIDESTEARQLKRLVKSMLVKEGHTVYDCTVNDAPSVMDNLKQIVAKCNAHKVDYDISIHFNAGACDQSGNKQTTGTEVYVYSDTSKAKALAKKVVDGIANTGLKNRGVKVNPSLYVLKNTDNPAMLIEVCFVDDKDDYKAYDRKKVAQAIVDALIGNKTSKTTTSSTSSKKVENKANKDVKKYSLKKDGEKNLSEHFKVKEFACHNGSDAILISDKLVELLEKIRTYFGKPVTINSAYRPADYNASIGGAKASQHVLGTAADIVVQGVSPSRVYTYCDKINPNGGVGKYVNFTHVDVRDGKARWNG